MSAKLAPPPLIVLFLCFFWPPRTWPPKGGVFIARVVAAWTPSSASRPPSATTTTPPLPPRLSPPPPPPLVYTMAGSDSGGGAGIQADLHAIHAMGGHACTLVTCLTAQNSVGVTAVHYPPLTFLQEQWQALYQDLSPPLAWKIGMLGTKDIARQVAHCLQQLRRDEAAASPSTTSSTSTAATSATDAPPHCWVILDPVMISTSGSRLMDPEAEQVLKQELFPWIDGLTPNLLEAQALLGRTLSTLTEMEQGAQDLLAMMITAQRTLALDPRPVMVLIKGGHMLSNSDENDDDDDEEESSSMARDYLLSWSPGPFAAAADEPRLCDAARGVWLQSPRYDSVHTHGTGCTLSSAMATALALGEQQRKWLGQKDVKNHNNDMDHNQNGRHQPNLNPAPPLQGARLAMDPVDACCLAKAYVTAGIAQGVGLGQGPGPVAQTTFPRSHEYFPTIVVPGTTKTRPFRRLLAAQLWQPMDQNSYSSSSSSAAVERLGSILPIVNSLEWVERLCQASVSGVTDIQLRVKNVNKDEVLPLVQKCQAICRNHGVRLWINDYWQEAIEAGCFGVHMGQEDLARCIDRGGLQLLQERDLALGISTHSYGELAVALGCRPSYISLGPIFATQSKSVRFLPQGLETVTHWRQLITPDIPLVAIGGIGSPDQANLVRQAGANCIALIGGITQAPDVDASVRAFCASLLVQPQITPSTS